MNELEKVLEETGSSVTLDDLRKRYAELCAVRDATLTRIAPLQKQLDDARIVAEQARVHCTTVAEQLSAARGGMAWFKLKKEIGLLAKALGGK